jgi:peptidoglycan/xylan/chitin deacetylase (PgdA/CDA1 family)
VLIKSLRLLLSCAVLVVACGWGFLGNPQINNAQKRSTPHPQSIAKAALAPEKTIPATEVEPASPQPLPAPPSQAVPLPAPEPQLTRWAGSVEPLVKDPLQIPVLLRVPTDKPVVFLGIDDGLVKSSEAKSWLTSHHLPFTLFLQDNLISNDYDYFRDLQSAGMTIQDHTITHTDLATLSLDQQKAEICGAADKFAAAFGARPTLFRPPYGSYNELTRQAAAECGMRALIVWHAKANGGAIQFQDGNTHFLPGDIVLMHFRPEFLQDMKAFTTQAANDGLQVGRLEDWIQ